MEMNMNDFKFEVLFDSSEGWVVRLGDVKNIIDHLGNINSKLKRNCDMWKNGYRTLYKELEETRQNERQKFFDEIKNLFK